MTLRDLLNPWRALRQARAAAAHSERFADSVHRNNRILANMVTQRGKALRDIAAMETAKPNATVKRMAERAREGMK